MFKVLNKADKKQYLQLFLITIAVHMFMLRNGFTYYSDDTYILLNPIVKHVSFENLKLIFQCYFDGHYHPLTLLSLAINYAISGDQAWSYNLLNLLIHASNVVLIFIVIKQFLKKPELAFAVALLWALHPLHVESVARITDRKDTQYVFFLLLSMINYLKYRESVNRKFLLYTTIAFVLSLLSKGQALVLPAILALTEWYNYKTSNVKPDLKPALYLLPFSLLFVWITYRAQLFTGYISQSEEITFAQMIFYPSAILSHYVLIFFAPYNLSAQYTVPDIQDISHRYELMLIPLLLIGSVVVAYLKKQNVLVFGLLFYLICISMTLRFIPIAENFMPDRYNYLASLGFCVALAQVYFMLVEKYSGLKYVAYGYLAVLSLVSFLRVQVWKDGESIWLDALKKYPDDTNVLQNLGEIKLAKNNPGEALNYLSAAIKTDSLNVLARLALYKSYMALNDKGNAKKELLHILKLKTRTANQYSNQAAVYAQFGMYDIARELNQNSLERYPLFIKFRVNDLSYDFFMLQFAQGIKKTDELLKTDPYCANMLYEMRAKANIALFNTEEAKADIRMAERTGSSKAIVAGLTQLNANVGTQFLASQSSDYHTLLETGKALYSAQAYANALIVFEKCNRIKPDEEAVLNNICACYFNLSRPDKVKEVYARILNKQFKRNANIEAYLAENVLNL